MINLSKSSIEPSAQFLEQARQVHAYTGQDRGDKTWLRTPSGAVAFVRGHINPAIKLRTECRTIWTVTSLTPLEFAAIGSGIPTLELVPTGPVGIRRRDHWDSSGDVIAWAHGARTLDPSAPRA